MAEMTSKQRLLAALTGKMPDRLPVTTHHVMPYYLDRFLPGRSDQDFFDEFGLDAITWSVPHKPAPDSADYPDPLQGKPGFLESRRVANDNWRVYAEDVGGSGRTLTRYRFVTPAGSLSMVLEDAEYTSWVVEPLIKQKGDIDLIGRYVTAPRCDVEALNQTADAFGERGLVRGHICCFDVFGQPGCWQDAACLVGAQSLILAAHDDPEWVDELLRILQRRKLAFIESLAGARYDILELGGGDGSASVISPRLFDRFVAPYDAPLVEAAHRAGQRIVYHLCGRIMPMLDRVLDMGVDAIETFTPAGMGGDADLARAKARVGGRASMIGGFDQLQFFMECDPVATRAEVRRCFREAGQGGRYILSPSDHFFAARPELLRVFAEEARACVY
jgi:uroporphyrinogen decarboxylase